MSADVIMFQGTASAVGKSVITAAFCRILKSMGVRVAPFKAVNMSNNAWVTADGKEMAVAQAMQAMACAVEPRVEMNPVLLKPISDRRCQLICLGHPLATISYTDWIRYADRIEEAIERSLVRLMTEYDVLVLEGAGSPAEINLRRTDWANMFVARKTHAAVILIGDIERGGVFAQFVGTLALLDEEDQRRIKGFLINKFRGDRRLVDAGVKWLEEKTGRPVFGVLPYWEEPIVVAEEDSLAQRWSGSVAYESGHPQASLRIDVIRYPHIANFTDLDPLHREPAIQIRYLTDRPHTGMPPHLILLPGSRSTVSDLIWMRGRGLDRYLVDCLNQGTEVIGICGGFQMLGETILDPEHVESDRTTTHGLGLLPISTQFSHSKITAQVRGEHQDSGLAVCGYEIHHGRAQGVKAEDAVFQIHERAGQPVNDWDGYRDRLHPVWGTYLHGLFDEDRFRKYILSRIRLRFGLMQPVGGSDSKDGQDPYDRLAMWVWRHAEVGRILETAIWKHSLSA